MPDIAVAEDEGDTSLGDTLDVPALDPRSSQALLGRAVKTGTGRPRDARPEGLAPTRREYTSCAPAWPLTSL
ncbi:hypothetical protein [Rhodococcus sp. B50]|uniref:hypothetical protein n=1 Tax=Rhodococcus sp. B50 TaxID=2682847 RepID=UPI001BD32BDA|nr:hypothetical protein [Rhodococcus sp. B50]